MWDGATARPVGRDPGVPPARRDHPAREPSASGEDDRPYAASLSAGLHAHWAALGGELSLGGDLVVVGPQTGLSDLQNRFHDLIDAPGVNVLDD
jgi:hypothetical protein